MYLELNINHLQLLKVEEIVQQCEKNKTKFPPNLEYCEIGGVPVNISDLIHQEMIYLKIFLFEEMYKYEDGYNRKLIFFFMDDKLIIETTNEFNNHNIIIDDKAKEIIIRYLNIFLKNPSDLLSDNNLTCKKLFNLIDCVTVPQSPLNRRRSCDADFDIETDINPDVEEDLQFILDENSNSDIETDGNRTDEIAFDVEKNGSDNICSIVKRTS